MALSKVSRALCTMLSPIWYVKRETEYVLWCFWQHGNHTQGVLKKRHGFKLCIWSLANCAYNCFFLLGMQQCYNTAAYQLRKTGSSSQTSRVNQIFLSYISIQKTKSATL